MNESPLISIALATYNGSRYIEEQLNSILNQTYTHIELIVVDDSSTDDTFSTLKKYADQHSNINIYKNDTNLGINKTFDRAINLCKGSYIAISDQDDIWVPHKLEKLLDNMKNNVLVYSHSALIDEKGGSLNRNMTQMSSLYEGGDPRSLILYNRAPGHTFLFRSDLKQHILPIPKHCYFDAWIALIATNLQSIGFVKEPLVLHRMHSNNATKSMKIKSTDDGFFYLNKYIESILEIKQLKHRYFFEEIHSILKIKNLRLKTMRYIFFQFKYCNIIYNKSFISNLNKARKLNIPPIPS